MNLLAPLHRSGHSAVPVKTTDWPEATIVEMPGCSLNKRTLAALVDSVRTILETRHEVILDMGQIETIDAHGLAFLLHSIRQQRERQGQVLLCNLRPAVRRLCEAGQIHRLVDIYNTTHEARLALRVAEWRSVA